MREIKVVNILEVDGKEIPFSDLAPEDQKRLAENIQDTAMGCAGYKRKTA